MDRVIHWIPGHFKEQLNYRHISNRTADLIDSQTAPVVDNLKPAGRDLYHEDVQIISKRGKLCYLPLSAERAA